MFPAPNVTEAELADAAQLASLSDETPEGRSIVVLAKDKYNLRGRELSAYAATFIPFTAVTRMSGVDLDGREIRKGAFDAIVQHCSTNGHRVPVEVEETVKTISNSGGTPLLVAEDRKILGTIHLKDIIKGGMRERFDHLRAMGIRTVMITGDNPAHGRRHRARSRALTIFSRRPSRKTSSRSSATSKPRASSSP